MFVCSCLVDDCIKRAQNEKDDWRERIVRNPETGNMVKVKSLPIPQQESYRPKQKPEGLEKKIEQKKEEFNKEKFNQDIDQKTRKLRKPRSPEERQLQFILPQLMKMHEGDSKQVSHAVKKTMKRLWLSHDKHKKMVEENLKHFTGDVWKSNRDDYPTASNERIKKIAAEIIANY